MAANMQHEPDPRFENVPENGLYGTANEGNTNQDKTTKKFRLQLSEQLHKAAVIAFISYLVLLVSFASPYWLSSYKFTDSAFKRLGLWDFCFEDYRHPSYQYDTKFTGCHWIYSPVYTNIRDWLQPPWFVFVQALMTISLCVATFGLIAASIIFMHFLIQYQLIILCITLLCHMLTTMLLGFALITFYLKSSDRNWITYPNLNHVDWAFFAGILSLLGNGYSSYLYYWEVKSLRERMLKMKRLVVATSGGNSFSGGDRDSLDAMYASRSANIYNHSVTEDNQQARNQKNTLIYPHFTQV